MNTSAWRWQLLSDLTTRNGIKVFAALNRDELEKALKAQVPKLTAWQENGYAGDMRYMTRPPDLLCDPSKLLSDYRSVVSCFIPYCIEYEANDIECPEDSARLARYARVPDYHQVVKEVLERVVAEFRKEAGEFRCRIFVDAVPLLERTVAKEASYGFIGKNTTLIVPKIGSYGFLAEILFSIDIECELAEGSSGSCKTCSRCIDSCPTRAFQSPYCLDARACVSYLTIEKKGSFTFAEMERVGEWLFGCDGCQIVCPFNHKRSVGQSVFANTIFGPFIRLSDVLGLRSEDDFRRFAGKSVLTRTGREGLIRNALAVIASCKKLLLADDVIRCAEEDESSFVRSEASRVLSILVAHADGNHRRKIAQILDKKPI